LSKTKQKETIFGTMSDLAPFVAAALRDKVVDELQEEIRSLTVRL
jgi:hypothetical protein